MAADKILIVEDEYIVAMDIRSRLKSLGYEVVGTVASGEEAVETAVGSRPDLVLMDIMLDGEMDGIMAAEQIQQQSGIPIVFLTAYSEQDTLQRAKNTEPYGYILKPFQERELHANIEIALHKYRLEQKVREQEERLKLAIEGVGGGIWDIEFNSNDYYDFQQHNIFISDEIKEILHYSLSSTPNSLAEVFQYLHSEDLDRLLSNFDKHLKSRTELLTSEFRVIRNGEELGWFSINARSHRNKDGDIDRLTGVVWDVTERQEAGLRLERVNRLLRAIRNVNQLIVREDNPKRLIEFSCDTMVETMGFAAAWLVLFEPITVTDDHQIALTSDLLSVKEYAQRNVDEGFTEFLKEIEQGVLFPCTSGCLTSPNLTVITEKSEICERCPIHKTHPDGDVMGARIGYGDTVYGVLSVVLSEEYQDDPEEQDLFREMASDIGFAMYDIQLEKQHQAAIDRAEQAREQLEFVTDNLPIMLAYVNSSGEFVLANQNCEILFGLSKGELVGKRPSALGENRLSDKFSSAFRKVSAGETVEIKDVVQTQTGGVRHLQISFIPEPGETGGYFILGQDITERVEMEKERKRLQDQLMQSQKMEALGTLAGGIAHDFNNILTPLIGFTELSIRQISEESEVFENLQHVLASGHRAKDLVQQILTFGQRSEHTHKPLDMRDVLGETINLVRASLPATIRIDTEIPDESGMVMGDQTQIHQIIMNLCTNAKHAMREKGGILSVELQQVTLDDSNFEHVPELLPGEYLELSVSDTGTGMPESVRNRVFEPYFTTKSKGEGSGLGLSVAHGIVREHGGHIEVSSKLDKGSTFRIYLPLVSKESTTDHGGDQTDEIPRGTGSILIIDDEPYVVDWQKQALELLGYSITGMTDPAKALQTFREAPDRFDLVISDVTMPGMTGDILAEKIKSIRPDIPLILSTGYSEKVNFSNATDYFADKYLMKPVDWKQLALVVKDLITKDNP
ncbi:MAG: response regulator [Candidatus Marinimicrobia bacterium]|nr:response regulator [Candidatus Neomarinimicrobiota bacterium]MCF7829532.1 response regulator [Candidatus Neomarinimicrobiota bacterium]MCF7880070.1 response regulator [Candidatus Neomarinimicrobiota bacterium]